MPCFFRFFARFLAAAVLFAGSAGASTAGQPPLCPISDEIVIAAEDAFFPYSGLYKGKLRGFAVDIVSAAFGAAGCPVVFDVMPYSRCLREVEHGRQLGCFNTTGSAENRRNFVFHRTPLFKGKILIFAHPDTPAGFRQEYFRRKTFSVVRGYTYTDTFDADPQITKIEVDSDLQTLALAARKRADYAVVYEKVAAYHISNSPEIISPVPKPVRELVRFDLYVSFSRKTPRRAKAVVGVLDQGLDAIRADGTYARIETAWDDWLATGLKDGTPAPFWGAVSVGD
ncbi:substrate-binding periplasmic protein [Roseibium aggregatum]|uniref:Transporter substrate-binding domain-containing protein n=1 Tax=Roseibium aggregatum TaxID=187304 RepID=A0A939EDJ8_9HYPH|nr:transporter substrate-binding domain-containing protein [Roseibium aggregatum]MBN9670133.1 transporter substrate-binding domain-containing protein [Roseibium aggregatum]